MPPFDVGYALQERNRTLSVQMMESGSFTQVRGRPLGRLCATLLVASVVALGACSAPEKKPAAPGRIFAGVKEPTVDAVVAPKPAESQRERGDLPWT